MNPLHDGVRILTGVDFFAKGYSDQEMNTIYYGLSADPEDARLLCESASFSDIDDAWNAGEDIIVESVRVKRFANTEAKMLALVKSLNKHGESGIVAAAPVIGTPRKSGLFATVTVQIPLSDGQVISILFHAPGGNDKKILPDDTIVAFAWKLNKKDITHVVSPESGKDVSLEQTCIRLMQLAAKNSEAFQKGQGDVAAQKAELAEVTQNIDALEAQRLSILDEVSALTERSGSVDADIKDASARLEKVKQSNADLRAEIDALKIRRDEQAASDSKVSEYNRRVALGAERVPGLRLQDLEQAGIMAELLDKGEITQAEWDKYVDQLKAENRIVLTDPLPADEGPAEDETAASTEVTKPDPLPVESRISEGKANIDAVVKDLGGVLGTWEPDKNRLGEWEKTTLTINGTELRLHVSGGGVVQVNGDPHTPGGSLNVTVEAVKESIMAALPAEEKKADETMPKEEGKAPIVPVLPPADQTDGMPAQRAAKLLYSLGYEASVMDGDFHRKVKSGSYTDLVIEARDEGPDGQRVIYFTQYIEMNGDLVTDSEMVFTTSADTGRLRLSGIAYRGPLGEVRRTKVGRPERSWANTFSKNLLSQGFDKGWVEGEEPPNKSVEEPQKPEQKYDIGFSWEAYPDGTRTISSFEFDGGKWAYGVKSSWMELGFTELIPVDQIDRMIEVDTANSKSRKEQAVRDAEGKSRADEARKEFENVNGFTDGMDPMRKEKTLVNLNSQRRFDGVVMTIKGKVESEISAGRKVVMRDGERFFTTDDGAFLTEKSLTKTGMDYAQYLQEKSASVPEPEPAPEPEPIVPPAEQNEPEPEPVIEPEPTPVPDQNEPEPSPSVEPQELAAVTVANDVLSGKYDHLTPGALADVIEQVFDLPEDQYADLMEKVDAYATALTKKAAA